MPKHHNDFRGDSTRRGMTGQDSFDELAKGLANGTITRVQALKFVGTAILGAILIPLPRLAFAQEDGCPPASNPCGDICCGAAEKCCPEGNCCGPTEECCAGACCEAGKVCVDGQCVCSPERTPCGSECCDPVLEECGEDGRCHNWFCESCWAQGGNCCQDVMNGVLVGQACCAQGESMCTRGGEGCICCPAGTRCPDEDLGEVFSCVSL